MLKVILKKARDNLSCCCICANKRSYTNHCPTSIGFLSFLWIACIVSHQLWRSFTSKYILLAVFSNYLRRRWYVLIKISFNLSVFTRDTGIRSSSAFTSFKNWQGIKLCSNSNAWIAIKDFKEKQTCNDRNRLQDIQLSVTHLRRTRS